jgi:hypothetical protein
MRKLTAPVAPFPLLIGKRGYRGALKSANSVVIISLLGWENPRGDSRLRSAALSRCGMESSVPVFLKIDKERKLVLTTGSGFVTKEEVLAHQEQILKDPEFDPSFSQLADFARLTNTDVSMADLKTFAQQDIFSIHSRRAIVVKGDLAFGFAKIFELYRQLAGAHGIRVFRDSDEALEWLLAPDAVSTSPSKESTAGSALR